MDKAAKKFLLRQIPFGLYIAGARQGDRVHAFLLSWFSQCSFDPPLVMMGVKRDGHAHEMLRGEKVATVNFLDRSQVAIATDFLRTARLEGDKLSGHPFQLAKNGAPVLDEAPGFLELKLVHDFAHGDHTVMVFEVVGAELRREFDLLTERDTGWTYGG